MYSVKSAAGGPWFCAEPQVDATRWPEAESESYVRVKMVPPSTAQAIEVQTKIKMIAMIRLVMETPLIETASGLGKLTGG
jgi:hypothetical protein